MPDDTAQTQREDRRIALLGPVLPFRGGIAQHTTRLRQALDPLVALRTYSFSRQYPRWLFPGENDRDPDLEGYAEPGVDYCLDSLNPLTWSRTARKIRAFGPQALVLPWWTVYWAPLYLYLCSFMQRTGIPVLFMCHNVCDHEAAGWKTRLTRKVLSTASGYLVHSRAESDRLRHLGLQAPVWIHPHPIYDQFPPAQGRLPRRAGLELLFFGFVRPYKGLDVLFQALARLPSGKDYRLSVVGEIWKGGDDYRAMAARLGIADRVEFVSRYVSDREAAEYFQRADAVVLPYRNATGSGVVPVAYHYGKPVVVTRVGGLPDVVRAGETGFIVEPDDPRALADVLAGLTPEGCRGMREAIGELKREFTWQRLAEVLLSGRAELRP